MISALGPLSSRQVVSLQALSYDHPMSKWMRKMPCRGTIHATPVSAMWRRHKDRLQATVMPETTRRDWIGPAPWTAPPDIVIAETPELAIQTDRNWRPGISMYTDASVRNGVCGIGVSRPGAPISTTVGRQDTCSILSAEIKAIQTAVENAETTHTWIMTDSQEALKVIRMAGKSSKAVEACQSVRTALARAQEQGRAIHLRWVPAHSSVRGNEEADRLAKAATREGVKVTKEPTRRIAEARLIRKLIEADIDKRAEEAIGKGWGKYTFRLDKALPGRHTKALYDSLSAEQAKILAQARTNHTHLLSFQARIGQAQSAECACRKARDTIEHLLLGCQRWDHLRTELKQKAGLRWGDLSYMLGGYSERKDWKTGKPIDGEKSKWKPNLDMVKATIQFLQQTGRMAGGSYENEAEPTSTAGTQ